MAGDLPASTPETARALRGTPLGRLAAWLGGGLACAALVALCARLAPSLALSARPAFTLAFALVSAEILLVARLAPALRGPLLWGSWLTAFGALTWLDGARLTGESAASVTALLLWTATGLGAALGGRIERPGHLLAVAAVSAVSDLWSVYDPTGPSALLARRVAEQPDQISAFALCFPLLGTPHIPALIGAGDVLFAALYLAAFERHRLPTRKALLGLAAGFAVGVVLLLWLERPVPLLPLLGAGIVASDSRVRTLPAKEVRSVLVVLAVLSVVLVLRMWR